MPASHPMHTREAASPFHPMPVQVAARAFAVVFSCLGVLGFVPGITADLDGITWAGHDSVAALFGIFDVSVLHNLLHLAYGVAGVVLLRSFATARAYLVAGGAGYLALFVHGLVVDHDGAANVLPVNDADDWLHLALGVAMVALGVALGRSHRRVVPTPPHR